MLIKDIVYISLFAAITAAMALFPPFPLAFGVPITVQNTAPWLAGAILGAKRGFFSQFLFIILVLSGLPLLSGGRGGLGILAGPTAGFMLSWPLSAFIIGAWVEQAWRNICLFKLLIIIFIGGLGISNLIGIPWMALILHLNLYQALLSALIFIPGDIIKIIIAAIISRSVKYHYPLIDRSPNNF